MSGDNDEIILADLDDNELVQQMQDDLYDGATVFCSYLKSCKLPMR